MLLFATPCATCVKLQHNTEKKQTLEGDTLALDRLNRQRELNF